MEQLLTQREVPAAQEQARRARFPLGAALEYADLAEAGREGALDRVREHEPITWAPFIGVGSSPAGMPPARYSAATAASPLRPSRTWCAQQRAG